MRRKLHEPKFSFKKIKSQTKRWIDIEYKSEKKGNS